VYTRGFQPFRIHHSSDLGINFNGSHTNNDNNKINKFLFCTVDTAPFIITGEARKNRDTQVENPKYILCSAREHAGSDNEL